MKVNSKSSVKTEVTVKPKSAIKINKKNSSTRVKKAIRQPEERYRTILDETEEAYYELDLAGNFIFMNDATCHHLGYSKEELQGVNFRDHVTKEDFEKVYNHFSNIYKTGKPERAMIYRVKAKDGSIIIVENTGFPLRNQKGEIIGFRGIARDITERKRMEEALRQSEEKYRAIIENIKDGYFEIDLSGNFTFFNEALREIHGYPKKELMGMGNRQYADKENAKKVLEAFQAIYKTGKAGSIFDYEIIKKDGTKRQVEVSASLKKDSSGNPTGFRGITRDVTERKQTEEAIHQSEERYRTILDEMEDGYFEVDLAGNFTFVNDADCLLLGYPREELLGASFKGHVNKEDVETVYNAFGKIYSTGKPERGISYTSIRPDGTTRFAEISGFPLQNQKGEIIGFRGIGQDVTERRRMEEALRQSEERYRTILEEMEEAYFEVDLAGNYTYVNDANCRILQYSKEEMLGKNFQLGMSEDDYKSVYNIFSNIYATGEPQKNIIFKGIRKDGTIGFAELTGFPLKNQKGEIIGFRGIGFDITEHKLMEEALRQSEERYRTIIEEMEEWYFETDLSGNITFFNDAITRAFKYPQNKLTGLNFRSFMKQEQAEEIYKIFNQVYKTDEPIKNFPQEFVRPDSSITFAEFSIFPKRDHLGKIYGFRGVAHDITERKKTEQQLNYMATHDNLTRLPNRVLFMDRLKMALTHAKRNKHKLAVMMLDLDRFKNINDTLGHVAGDRLLKEIGVRLTGLLRQNDTVSRFGGDEFIVLLPEIVRMEDVREVAEKIIKIIQQPFIIDSYKLDISASIGIVIYPDDCQDIDSLMKNADMAMYSVKSHGRNGHQFFGNINQ